MMSWSCWMKCSRFSTVRIIRRLFPKEQDEDFVSLEEEVARAIAKEEVVKLSELDVPYFTKSGTLSEEKLKK